MHSSSCFLVFWVTLFIFCFPSLSLSQPANNVTLYGDAHFRNNAISLTQEFTCLSTSSSSSSSSTSSSSSGVGRALYVYPIRFLDTTTNTTASFSCRFSFSILSSPLCPFGDGFTFLITSNADSFSHSIGYMGLPATALSPEDSFFAVEFDTSYDPSLGDINGNHIGIDVKSVISFASVDVESRGIDLKSGRQITAWIEYRDALKLIRVWAGYSQIRPTNPVLVAQVDLSKQFKEYMHVGFSAANGQGSAIHIVDRWRFKTFAPYPSVNPIDMVEQGDCFMCYPADSGNGDFRDQKTKIREMAIEFGGLAAFVFSIIAIVGVISFLLVRKKRHFGRNKEAQACPMQTNRVPTRLSLAKIKSATLGFNRNRIVGQGASATVYKGSLPSGGAVAVKRFNKVNQFECTRNPFSTEFGTMVGCLRHKNLVQLQGWCCEGTELVLVYEYLPNGSLDRILHNCSSSANLLSWEKRVNILLGVASALTYLHEECERQIIHRDVKTCNIMLDADFNAKLGDFGLAEVYEHSCISREATIPAGTMGYLAPEYVYSGVPTQKTDVYSFGVVILEVATGRRPVDNDGVVIVDWVWNQWENGKLHEAADFRLRGRFDLLEIERMLMVGLSCVHPDHEKRPTVKQAARILRGEAPLPLLPPKKPTVNIRSVLPKTSEEVMNLGGHQSPDLDDPPWLTPRSHFS
ncbi:hypothetical protein ACOSQ2_009928 [Xanthoceras sorbifolium]